MRLNFTKWKMAFATLALALVAFLSVPNSSAQASSLLNTVTTQSEQAQPLEMRRYGGGYRRGGGWRRGGYGHRRIYRPRPYYGAYYAPRPAYCRTFVRYDRWGYPRYVRRCR